MVIAKQVRRSPKLSQAAEGVCDGRWPHPPAPRGTDSAPAPRGEGRKRHGVMSSSMPTFFPARAGADTGLPHPTVEELLDSRTHGTSSRNFYELRARSPKAAYSSYPFYDLDNAGGKANTTVINAAKMGRRYSLMRSHSDMRFRGAGGASFGLYISTPDNLGPGQYIQHTSWDLDQARSIMRRDGDGHAVDDVGLEGTSAPASPASTHGGSESFGSLSHRRSPRDPPAECYNRDPRREQMSFRSTQPRLPMGPTSWMILPGRTSEVNGDTLDMDERHRTTKFGGGKKGALFLKGDRMLG